MLDVPGAFLGEFDALDGPKVSYAFEYFAYSSGAKENYVVRQLLYFVEGDVIIGKHVASGQLHHEYSTFLNSVAARVLTSNETHEERLLYQESGCPCVGSFLFSLPDILARGEKRRFCLIFLHPSYHELVSRWDYLTSFVEVLLKEWTRLTTSRYQREYSTFPNLEQLREDARCKPLRSIMELISEAASNCVSRTFLDSREAFERAHCFFEVVLCHALSHPISLVRSTNPAGGSESERVLDAFIPLAQSAMQHMNLDMEASDKVDLYHPTFTQHLLIVDSEIVVKPLCIWLLRFIADAPLTEQGAALKSVQNLLRTLFCGNQIVITGKDAHHCASFALSLSYVLPEPLVKHYIGSDIYRMPYECRVLTFSQDALSHLEVFASPSSHASAPSPDKKPCLNLKLFDMEADEIIHVCVEDGWIKHIDDCDELRRSFRVVSGSAPDGESTTQPPTTTLVTRLLTLLQTFLAPQRFSAITSKSLQLLTAQVQQLVHEYVVRGRVYTLLFQHQELLANRIWLHHGAYPASPTAATPTRTAIPGSLLLSPIRKCFATYWTGDMMKVRGSGGWYLGPEETIGITPPSPPHSSGIRVTKHKHLRDCGKQFERGNYVFSSFAPEDHAILTFLGST